MTSGQPHEPADPTFAFGEALSREYRAIWRNAETFPTADDYVRHVLADGHAKQSALCLSGGGIRSAAFALGVIQSLARQGLLTKFHYLSTVSGGGYIGGWLQAWIRAVARAPEPPADPVADVQDGLRRMEPRPLDVLRGFTSYLAPQSGLASPDIWTGFVLVARNMAINWAMFGPALFALALLPALYRDLLQDMPGLAGPPLLLLALLLAGWATYATASRLPSHIGAAAVFAAPDEIRRRMAAPAVLWALLLPLSLAPALFAGGAAFDVRAARWILPVGMFAALMAGYGLAWRRARGGRLFRANLGAWTAACVIACAVLAAGVALAPIAAGGVALWTGGLSGAAVLAVVGPVWAMLSHLCLNSVFVALRREALRGELDREWLARLSAVKIVPVLIWATFCAICLILSPLLLGPDVWAFAGWATGLVTTASGLIARFFGKSARTLAAGGAASGGGLAFDQVALVATAVFGTGLFVLLAGAGEAAVGGRPFATLAVAAAAFGLAWWLGERVNINRFSLHNVYRNRLTRAFLGSGRQTNEAARRSEDPFTKFDPADNPRVHELKPPSGSRRKLFPVIGAAMNLVGGAPNAWAERKAAPFSITPVACGSESLPSPPGQVGGRFVDPAVFGGREKETGDDDAACGISLGTAIAISGAAVSPNMGYHSSPATAFLMTLFNVRLGVWLPNPARATPDALRQAKPPNSLRALVDEMLGRTGYDGPAIYLSDGGHFDNLGLYEMVRRGCRLIVVVDSGEDYDFAFRDLADALRKIRIDQRVEIAFETPMPMVSAAAWKADENRPFALATITWPNAGSDGPGAVGHLLYIKPCLFDGVPLDLLAYAKQDDHFPNDSTADQFFTESRFESYRRLGLFIADQLRDEARTNASVQAFLRKLAAVA